MTQYRGLNGCRKDQLTAINQTFLHARMAKDWGLGEFNDKEYHRSIRAMKHADARVERMLFLEAQPDFSKPMQPRVSKDVKEMLKKDLEVEYEVVDELKKAIRVCEKELDHDAREIVVKLLDDTDMDHAYGLEQQPGLIEKIGPKNYLQWQM